MTHIYAPPVKNNSGDNMIISVIRTVILYVFVIAAIRLMGKRQIGDMQPSELVATMVVSNIASIPMQNNAQPLLSGMVPVLVLVTLEVAVSVLMLKSRRLQRLVCGAPVVIIEDGRLLQRHMKQLRLSVDELCAQLRQQNVFSVADVQYCIMETNGTISVLEKPEKRVPTAEDCGVRIHDSKMQAAVIIDGSLQTQNLPLCGQTAEDVQRILNEKNLALSDVFLMTTDSEGKAYIVRKEPA